MGVHPVWVHGILRQTHLVDIWRILSQRMSLLMQHVVGARIQLVAWRFDHYLPPPPMPHPPSASTSTNPRSSSTINMAPTSHATPPWPSPLTPHPPPHDPPLSSQTSPPPTPPSTNPTSDLLCLSDRPESIDPSSPHDPHPLVPSSLERMLRLGEMICIPRDVFPTYLQASLFPTRGTDHASGSTAGGNDTYGGLTCNDDDMVLGVD